MSNVAVITGASSGVGHALCILLAQRHWQVAAVARRTPRFDEPIRSRIHSISCDVADPAQVQMMAAEVLDRFGRVDVLVNSAGTNAPKRALSVLDLETYHRLIAVNLHGAYYCVQAFLPSMRQNAGGTIVNIVSDAALSASPKAGPGYVAAKFGLRGLTQSINAEERGNGIRATAILPGDIDTALLELRPTPPTAEARQKMLQPEDVARCAMLAIELPPRAIVEELLVRPR